jgi:hypothetical protein
VCYVLATVLWRTLEFSTRRSRASKETNSSHGLASLERSLCAVENLVAEKISKSTTRTLSRQADCTSSRPSFRWISRSKYRFRDELVDRRIRDPSVLCCPLKIFGNLQVSDVFCVLCFEVVLRYPNYSPDWSKAPSGCAKTMTDASLYERLNNSRNDDYRAICADRIATRLPKALLKDQEAQKFMDNVLSAKDQPVIQFLTDKAREGVMASPSPSSGVAVVTPTAVKESRTVIMIDATQSMKKSMSCVQNSLQYLFKFIREVSGQEKSRFLMQIIVYRNYSDGPRDVIKASPVSLDPAVLIQFIEEHGRCFGGGIGGGAREAIEVGLQYVNDHMNEFEPTQIIIMGDASYNGKIRVGNLRSNYARDHNDKYAWKDFAAETTFESEEKRLAKHVISDRANTDSASNNSSSSSSSSSNARSNPANKSKVKIHTFYVEK